jgi:polyhydroxybutyrate depolymerase
MRKVFFLFLATSLFILVSCRKNEPLSPADPSAEQTTQTLTVDSRERTYTRYLPANWRNTTQFSLMFVLHGGGGTPESMQKMVDFRAIADREQIILIYPTGIDEHWNDGRPTSPNVLGINDVKFVSEIITNVSKLFSIDPKSIFSTGISNGGFMSSRLACELSDKFAAVAVVAASMEKNTVAANCNPSNPVSTIYIHGTTDPIVPFLGGTMTKGEGGVILSHTEAISKWRTINNCKPTPSITDVPDIANDGTTIKKTQYTAGNKGSEVVSYVVQNGGHTWPQAISNVPEFLVGKTSQDMNTNEVIWTFFKTHKKM